MKTLATKTMERQGNDCWLKDVFEIILDDGEYILRHTHKYTGWSNGRNTYEISLGDDILLTYPKLYDYLELNSHTEVSPNWYEW